MNYSELETIGIRATELIKSASWFPYKTGRLKYQATSGAMYMDDVFRIHFSSAVAPYVVYLEEGTSRSTKHQGFIKDKCVSAIVYFIADKYEGEVTVA